VAEALDLLEDGAWTVEVVEQSSLEAIRSKTEMLVDQDEVAFLDRRLILIVYFH
jgi:hypothetical protein